MSSDPLIGKKLGNYDIKKLIGKGGMAGVYEGFQPSMNRTVAIKVMAQQLTVDDAFITRFKNEAQLIAHLEHAHILPVYDFGEDSGTLYIVMRYLDAGTLEDRIGEKGMPVKEAVSLFGQLANALDYAHSKGVVHRDLKPSNVLIDKQGNAFLSDFGIAKSLEGGTQNLTGTGGVVGTPTYMSPEQGLGGTVDSRSDIYALGVILFEMLTGTVPFWADNPMAVMLKHINDVPPAPTSINPSISPAVESVVLRALSKQPEARFDTAQHMADALVSATTTGTFATVRPSVDEGGTLPVGRAAQASTLPSPVAAQAQPATPTPSVLPQAGAAVPVPTPLPTAVPMPTMPEAPLAPYYAISPASAWLAEHVWIGKWLQAVGLSAATFLVLSRLTPGDMAQNAVLALIPGVFLYGLLNAPIPGGLVALGLIFLPLIAHAPALGILWLLGIASAGMQMTSREIAVFVVTLIASFTPIGWLLPLAAPWWLRNHRVAFGVALGVFFAGLFAVTLKGWDSPDHLLPQTGDTGQLQSVTQSEFDTSYLGLLDARVWNTWFTRPQDVLNNMRDSVGKMATFVIDTKGILLIVAAAWAISAIVSTINRTNPSFLIRGVWIGVGAVVLIIAHLFHAWAGVLAPDLLYLVGVGVGCAVISFLITQWPIQAPPPPRKKKKVAAAA